MSCVIVPKGRTSCWTFPSFPMRRTTRLNALFVHVKTTTTRIDRFHARLSLFCGAKRWRTSGHNQSASRAHRGGDGYSFGFEAMSGPSCLASLWHHRNTASFHHLAKGQNSISIEPFHGFRVSRRDVKSCFEKFFHADAETFDNFKNPVARFEGPGSIFREWLEPRMNTDAHG